MYSSTKAWCLSVQTRSSYFLFFFLVPRRLHGRLEFLLFAQLLIFRYFFSKICVTLSVLLPITVFCRWFQPFDILPWSKELFHKLIHRWSYFVLRELTLLWWSKQQMLQLLKYSRCFYPDFRLGCAAECNKAFYSHNIMVLWRQCGYSFRVITFFSNSHTLVLASVELLHTKVAKLAPS